jgi:hypothetical protein
MFCIEIVNLSFGKARFTIASESDRQSGFKQTRYAPATPSEEVGNLPYSPMR